MLRLGVLGLNDDSWHVTPLCMNDAAMRQPDVNMHCSNLACIPEIENGAPVFHVLLHGDTTVKTRRLPPPINVDFAPQFHARVKDLIMIRRKFVSPISAFPQAMLLEKGRHGSFFIGGVESGNSKLLDQI
jgi:hypothetical protein